MKNQEKKATNVVKTTQDANFNALFAKFTKLVGTRSLTAIKAKKPAILRFLKTDTASYRILLAEYKHLQFTAIDSEKKATKLAVRDFSTALNAAFAAAQKSKEFGSKIAKIRKEDKNFTVATFVALYYKYMQQDSFNALADVLIPAIGYSIDSNNNLYKATTLEPLTANKATYTRAYSIICNCIDNYYLAEKNTFKGTDKKLNIWAEGTVLSISKFSQDTQKFEKTKLTSVDGFSSISSEEAKELQK